MSGVLPDQTLIEQNNIISRTIGDTGYNIYDELSGGVENILDAEHIRLTTKEGKINKLYETQTRKKHYKNSISKRNNAYWRMFMLLVFLAIIVVLLYMFRKNFPLVPSWAMDLILIAVVSGGFIYMFIMYENILKRDLTDFEKMDPYSPLIMRKEQITKGQEDLEKGKISQARAANVIPSCKGQECCTPGTYYDGSTCVESFTTIEQIKPYESKSYSPY